MFFFLPFFLGLSIMASGVVRVSSALV
jgi:hypothetical protein